mmetsp:Transcript_17182/g.29692  ORF Transcript_17182/g.29692 Transcript_17182/m.29692 type:complete len:149 (+) Transcript_17182:112-558(+)
MADTPPICTLADNRVLQEFIPKRPSLSSRILWPKLRIRLAPSLHVSVEMRWKLDRNHRFIVGGESALDGTSNWIFEIENWHFPYVRAKGAPRPAIGVHLPLALDSLTSLVVGADYFLPSFPLSPSIPQPPDSKPYAWFVEIERALPLF